MPLWAWSYILTAVGIAGLFLAGSKNKLGWLLGVFAQALWITYATVSHQYGFYISAVAYAWVYGRNYWKWHKEAKLVDA